MVASKVLFSELNKQAVMARVGLQNEIPDHPETIRNLAAARGGRIHVLFGIPAGDEFRGGRGAC